MMNTNPPVGFRDELEFDRDYGIHEYRTSTPFFLDDFRPVLIRFEFSESNRPCIIRVELGSRPDKEGRITWQDETDRLYHDQLFELESEIQAAVRLSDARARDEMADALAEDY